MKYEIKKLLLALKELPKYQFERRIDIFILEQLEDVLSKILKEEVHFLYPEFPLRSLSGINNMKFLKTIEKGINNLKPVGTMHNTNVDYLLASEKFFYFVELKTDVESFKKDSQLIYYSYYSRKEFKDLYDFFKQLKKTQKKKWEAGFKYFNDNFDGKLDREIKIIYLGPKAIKETKEYKKLENELKDKLIFVSLSDFANKITDNGNFKKLLKDIDE